MSTSFKRSKGIVAILLATTMLTIVFANQVTAQTASFRSVDTNRDGVLDLGELEAAFGRVGALQLLSTIDQNGDRRITILELRARQNGDGPSSNGSDGHKNDDQDDDDDGDDDNGDDDGDGDNGDDGDDDGGDSDDGDDGDDD